MEHSPLTGISEWDVLSGETGIISEFKHSEFKTKQIPFSYLECCLSNL